MNKMLMTCAYMAFTATFGFAIPFNRYDRDDTFLPCQFDITRISAMMKKTQLPSRLFESTQGVQAVKTESPFIKRIGTIDCDLVETTPVIFHGRLYRFEWVRHPYYKPNKTGSPYYRFIDVEKGTPTAGFGQGYFFGSAIAENDTMYVFGAREPNTCQMDVFYSKDLVHWDKKVAFKTPNWTVYNNSVCKGPDGYVMAFELGGPPEIVGVRFTNRFAKSKDLLNWEILPEPCVFAKDRYTACPTIRYVDGYYYIVYLEKYVPGPEYKTHIVRTRDLANFENSPCNPIMTASDEDKIIANPSISQEERTRIAGIKNINNSDVDFCEYNGKTVIYYSWGTQLGDEFLAEAKYDGTLSEFLKGFFRE